MMDSKRIAAHVIPNGVFGVRNLSTAKVKDSSEDLGMTGGVAALEAEIQQGMAELREMLV